MKEKCISKKKIFDEKGNVAVNNLNAKLMEQVINQMKRTNGGICVARQFVYGTEYPMIIVNVRSETQGPESYIDVALWPDMDDADYYITRNFVFKRTERGIKKWEDFCEKVSNSSAIFEKDLIGNIFIGHIDSSKARYDNQVFYFENLVVDRFIGRIDPRQVNMVLPNKSNPATQKHTPVVADLLEDDEEE